MQPIADARPLSAPVASPPPQVVNLLPPQVVVRLRCVHERLAGLRMPECVRSGARPCFGVRTSH